jgi:hypothetical protein
MVVESAKKETDFSRSLDSAALLQAAEAARIAVFVLSHSLLLKTLAFRVSIGGSVAPASGPRDRTRQNKNQHEN